MAVTARTLILARIGMLRKNENGQQPWLPAVLGLLNQRLHRLPVSATVTTAAAVETATATSAVETATAAMEAAATAAAVEAAAPTVETSACGSVESIATVKPVATKSTAVASPSVACVAIVASTAPTATVAPAATPVKAVPPTAAPTTPPAIPGAGTDEHSTSEPISPIVAVWRTSVGRIAVVAVLAHRRSAHIARSNPHAHTHLRL
jgi:hypothetical protein